MGRGDRDPPETMPLIPVTAQWQDLMLPIFCVLPDPRALPGRGRSGGSHFKAPGSTSLHPTALGISLRATRRRSVRARTSGAVGGWWMDHLAALLGSRSF